MGTISFHKRFKSWAIAFYEADAKEGGRGRFGRRKVVDFFEARFSRLVSKMSGRFYWSVDRNLEMELLVTDKPLGVVSNPGRKGDHALREGSRRGWARFVVIILRYGMGIES